MKKDYSYGIIPLYHDGTIWKVYLVRQHQGHWGLPKGHPEPEEEPKSTAVRELQEETSLKLVRFLDLEPYNENYSFISDNIRIFKQVTYFAAVVEGKPAFQEGEVIDGKWVDLSSAHQDVTFSNASKILQDLNSKLDSLSY